MVGENRVEELAEAVRYGEATTDGANVVLAESTVCYEVGDGGREGFAAEVIAAPADKQGDVECPPPSQK